MSATLTTLADVPMNAVCQIVSTGAAVQALGYYALAGVRRGADARVLARYPEHSPRFAEVEVGDDLVISLPISLAADVVVSRAVM